MTEVHLERKGDALAAHTPFHGDFVRGARKLAGRWRGGAWVFPASQEDRVKGLCRKVFGTDGDPVETVTLRVEFHDRVTAECGSVFLAGRLVARATGRDSGAKLGEGVVLLEGGIGSGGSRQRWTTEIDADTVIEILDVPRPAAEEALRQDSGQMEFTIVAPSPADRAGAPVSLADTSALRAERARLQERIDAIDALLAAAVQAEEALPRPDTAPDPDDAGPAP